MTLYFIVHLSMSAPMKCPSTLLSPPFPSPPPSLSFPPAQRYPQPTLLSQMPPPPIETRFACRIRSSRGFPVRAAEMKHSTQRNHPDRSPFLWCDRMKRLSVPIRPKHLLFLPVRLSYSGPAPRYAPLQKRGDFCHSAFLSKSFFLTSIPYLLS